MALNQIFRKTIPPGAIRLRAVGDVNWGMGIGRKLRWEPGFAPLPGLQATLGAASVAFFNAECTPVADSAKFQGAHAMFAPAAFLDRLREEFNVVNIANNHILDAGEEAFAETLTELQRRQFVIVGGGLNLADACGLRMVTVQGLRVGFLGCADFMHTPDRRGNHAGRRKPGVWIYQPRQLLKHIRACRRQVDVLICSLHTGLEFHRAPDPGLVREARRMIAAGAHVILIHHAHVRRGLEFYQHGLIAYNLGNFMFDLADPYMQQPGAATNIGLILDIFLEPQGVAGYEFWLAHIQADGATTVLTDVHQAEAWYHEQLRLNEQLAHPDLLRQEWRHACRTVLKSRYYASYWAFERQEYRRFFYLLWDLQRRENRRWLLGLIGM